MLSHAQQKSTHAHQQPHLCIGTRNHTQPTPCFNTPTIQQVILTNYEAVDNKDTAAAAPVAPAGSEATTTTAATAAAAIEPVRRPLAVRVDKPQGTFRPDSTYLITGGGGGFGSTLLRHAHYEHGATSFLITTRSANHDKVRGRDH